MDPINKLTEHLSKLPGIGPRQARRLAYYLVRQRRTWIDSLAQSIVAANKSVSRCTSCFRTFILSPEHREICDICGDSLRDAGVRMIVEKDVDFENIERSDVYHGKYFILGGTVTLMDKEPDEKIRSREAFTIVEQEAAAGTLKEIILALSATPDGEDTAAYMTRMLSPLAETHGLIISRFGRGLSTGSELEYADAETIKSAFQNRK